MQNSLNIMYDNWLPVIMCDGTYKDISLYTAITEAQSIKKLQKIGDVNIEEYSIYAFIFDFVQWVYKPIGYDKEEKQEAIEELFENGCFDKEILDKYISEYEASGHSFNLFDENYPFMQMSKKEWDTYGKVKEATPFTSPKFGVGFLSGFNVLFEHGDSYPTYEEYIKLSNNNLTTPGKDVGYESKTHVEDIVELTPARLFASILYGTAYKHASGGGTYSSACMKLAHPIFTVVFGNNLFETICASIGVCESYDYKPLWERDKYCITSTELNSSACDNNIALTYTPTIRMYPCNCSEIYSDNFKKDVDYQKTEKNFDNKPDYNTPKYAFDKWANNYPRILRAYKKDKKGNEFIYALTYTHDDIWHSHLKTNLMQLECCSDKCDVININYNVLNEKTNLKIRYYALAYKNASSNSLINYSETFETTNVLDSIARRRLSEMFEYIGILGRETAKAIATVDCIVRTNRSEKDVAVTNSFEATTEVSYLIQYCLSVLEQEKENRLANDNLDEYKALFNEIVQVFTNGFTEHKRYLPRHSALKYTEANNKYFWNINNIQEKFLKKYEEVDL